MHEVTEGQVYREQGRKLTVLSVELGGNVPGGHTQLSYAKCRADWPDGSMSIAWVALHKLLELPLISVPVSER